MDEDGGIPAGNRHADGRLYTSITHSVLLPHEASVCPGENKLACRQSQTAALGRNTNVDGVMLRRASRHRWADRPWLAWQAWRLAPVLTAWHWKAIRLAPNALSASLGAWAPQPDHGGLNRTLLDPTRRIWGLGGAP